MIRVFLVSQPKQSVQAKSLDLIFLHFIGKLPNSFLLLGQEKNRKYVTEKYKMQINTFFNII